MSKPNKKTPQNEAVMEINGHFLIKDDTVFITSIYGTDTVSSLDVSSVLGKKHNDFIRSLNRSNIESFDDSIKDTYRDSTNREQYFYRMPIIEAIKLVESFRNNTTNRAELLSELYKLNGKKVIVKGYERRELEFAREIEQFFMAFNIDIETQYRIGKYNVDIFIPKLRLIIEYCESHHSTTLTKINDILREDEIMNTISCSILRVSDYNSVGYNVGEVARAFMNSVNGNGYVDIMLDAVDYRHEKHKRR